MLNLDKQGRIIAIDFGLKKLGIAISDFKNTQVTKYFSINYNKNNDILHNEIIKSLKEWNISKLIIGYPISMNQNNKFSIQKSIEIFFNFMEKKYENTILNVEKFNESFSTIMAKREFTSMCLKKSEWKKYKDALSAKIILESYLDKINIK